MWNQWESSYRTGLQDNAIPSIFDLTSHLNNPHSRHRKHIKELSENEIRTLKWKKKNDETSEKDQVMRKAAHGKLIVIIVFAKL